MGDTVRQLSTFAVQGAGGERREMREGRGEEAERPLVLARPCSQLHSGRNIGAGGPGSGGCERVGTRDSGGAAAGWR